MMKIETAKGKTEKDLARAVRVLRGGGVAAFPTETVYGLGAALAFPAAVARIFEIKRRPLWDPLIVHVADAAMARRLVRRAPPAARRLMAAFWPGPLTLILPKNNRAVPDLVTAGLPGVALRMPDHPLALRLLRRVGPVAAPSANLFGRTSPTAAAHVRRQLGGAVEFILDGGPCAVGVESTVLSLLGPRPELLRPGGLALERIEALIGPVRIPPPAARRAAAPGRHPRHYAPRTPLAFSATARPAAGKRTALLTLRPSRAAGFARRVALAPDGDLAAAAAGLYDALHRLDRGRYDRIIARPFPDRGLGRAINDRLRRAGAGHLRNRKES